MKFKRTRLAAVLAASASVLAACDRRDCRDQSGHPVPCPSGVGGGGHAFFGGGAGGGQSQAAGVSRGGFGGTGEGFGGFGGGE